MSKFKKGNKIGKGRPPGSKNKNFLDVSYWLGLANHEIEQEKDPFKRMGTIKWAVELIMQKVPLLPATPGDSVSNAIAAQALVKALEADANTNPSPVTAGG